MGAISAVKNETKRKKQMVVRRGYEKEDVVDTLERLCKGKSYAEVARKSSVPLRTLLKKSQGQHSGIMIEGLRTHVNINKVLRNLCIFIFSLIIALTGYLFLESVNFCCEHGI